MEVVYSPRQDCFGIRGDTYPHKDKLKAKGGKWNPNDKCWFFPSLKKRSDVEKVLKGCKRKKSK